MQLSSLRALLSLPLVVVAACQWNEVETGMNGQLELTPDNCGKLSCDLDDGIAVGGTLDLSLRGKDGRSASGLHLISSAPWVVQVLGSDGGFEPTFQIMGTGGGRADLIAIDDAGNEIDYLPVEVVTIGDLAMDADADSLVSLNVAGVDLAYQAATGAELTLDVSGLSLGHELTGDVQYLVSMDAELARATLPSSDVGRGHLKLIVPAGDHDLRYTAPGGASKLVRVMGR